MRNKCKKCDNGRKRKPDAIHLSTLQPMYLAHVQILGFVYISSLQSYLPKATKRTRLGPSVPLVLPLLLLLCATHQHAPPLKRPPLTRSHAPDYQRFSFVTPAGGGSSLAGQDDSDDDSDSDEEEEEDGGGSVDGAGMSEAEERLVASFMNAGEEGGVF